MIEPGSIAAGMQAIKTATGIAKTLRDADRNLAAAEYKMKLADLLEALSEARSQLFELQEANLELQQQIKQLESRRDIRSEVMLKDNVYVPKNDEVAGYGKGPWCSTCLETEDRLISLHRKTSLVVGDFVSYKWECPSCKASVSVPSQ